MIQKKININSLKNHQQLITNNERFKRFKSQQRFKRERNNAFTEEINKITLSSIDSIEAYSYGISKDLVSEKGEVKCNNINYTVND